MQKIVKILFVRCANEIIARFDADPSHQVVDEKLDTLMDKIVAAQKLALP